MTTSTSGDARTLKSICRMCHGGCAVLLTVEKGRLVKLRPDPDSHINEGQVCVKAPATLKAIYHPDRLLHPLKRIGSRGGGQWQQVSWETALSEIADKLDKIRTKSGPWSIALGQGTGRHHYLHTIRFANTLGSPNWYEPGLANCFIPRISMSNLTYGSFVAADYYGEVNPKTILFWGHNPLVSNPDGELQFPVRRALKNGSYGIAIDPRRTETARSCHQWVPLRPGTDAAVALGMIHAIINEGWYDRDFVEKWTVGFEELKQHVAQYTPEWAESVSGVPKATLLDMARRYALDKPSVIEWGVALEQTPNCSTNVRAVALLRGITGNLDQPGSDIMSWGIINPYPVMKQALSKEALDKRLGAREFKLLGGFRAFMPSAHIPAIYKAILTGEPYPIRALMLFGNNPLLTVANTKMVQEALHKVELLVTTDFFMTPSAELADYVLPAAMWPEVNQVVEVPFIAGNSVFAQQRVVQTGECRQDEEIMIDLARRLKLPGCDDSFEQILDGRLTPLGIGFTDLRQRFVVTKNHVYRKYETEGFHTGSGKVELISSALRKLGYEPLPIYREPPESPVSRPDLVGEFPYVLITGSRKKQFFHSENRQVSLLRQANPDPRAEFHPNIATRHGIEDGEWVHVSSPRGTIRMKALVTEEITDGVVNVDHAWWFPEKPGPDHGVMESNANILTNSEPPYDPAFGSYQLRGLLCKVEKIPA